MFVFFGNQNKLEIQLKLKTQKREKLKKKCGRALNYLKLTKVI